MKTTSFKLGLAAFSLAAFLTACQPSTEDPSASAAASSATETAPQARPTKADMLAEFDAALSAAQATSGPGSPAMWTLSDEDTTIHLFGTVHLLRPDLEWRSDVIDAAISGADTIVFEVDMKSEEAQRAVGRDFLSRGMFQDGRTLKGVLSDTDEAVVAGAFDSLGVPIDAMNSFEPWMASVNLGVMKLMNAAGKSFAYLETISQQTDAFDLLPEDEQITMLYETAVLLDESPRMLDLLVDEWAEGDVSGISSLVASPDGVGFTDAAYQALLVKRNQNWVPQIEAMLDAPGSVFIAVGAGHLAGPDSVITMLRDKGYTIEGP